MSDTFLEELKSMGRMDGDMIDCVGEARTIEGWRQECERLRGLGDLVVKLQAERQGWLDRIKANDATYDSLQREHRELKAECERLRGRAAQLEMQLSAAQRGDVTAGENEALRIIVRHLAKLL